LQISGCGVLRAGVKAWTIPALIEPGVMEAPAHLAVAHAACRPIFVELRRAAANLADVADCR
jgi:hypothetical protein